MQTEMGSYYNDIAEKTKLKDYVRHNALRLLEALGEVGISLPSSYIMLLVHLAWHAVCHALFQIKLQTFFRH